MKKIVFTFAVLFFYVFANAQENSLLWKISGNGLKKDSYLFGTLHMACGEDFRIPEKVKTALGTTDALAVEVDVTDPKNAALLQSKIAPKPTFFDNLSAEKKKAIDSALIANEIPPAIFDQVSPTVAISLLAIKGFDCPSMQDIKMMEHELKNLPEAKNKPIAELESATFQIDLLDSLFSAEDLYSYLTSAMDTKTVTKNLVKAYFSENLDEIEKITMNTAFLSGPKQEKLLDTRNRAWILKMPSMMNEKSYVFAVGAAHLIGNHGVIQLLKGKGYTVTAVSK
ncbi:TraB/GumN family protein [Sphingobacterium deserti]|uniref:GumN family protein n=1 Tax=Sphingobacterium deserti TaxID=1229276 RepID=A0A0B8SZZ7_9SPHI|nr:TraB/GumN family protein [Sphingobacterium deserti]KGE13366.1 GumN family protein [Sphingobacterium deserti]